MAKPKPSKKTNHKISFPFSSFWKRETNRLLKFFRKAKKEVRISLKKWIYISAGWILAFLVTTYLIKSGFFEREAVNQILLNPFFHIAIIPSMLLVYALEEKFSRHRNIKNFLTTFFTFMVIGQVARFLGRLFRAEEYSDKGEYLILFFVSLLILLFTVRGQVFPLLKRIYRNSEGQIIPLLGGVLALSVFYSINALMHVYVHAIDSDGNSESKTTVFLSLSIFTDILFLAWFIIYQIKKANLKDDTIKALEGMLIKHCEPYVHSRESGEIKNKNFYYSVYFNASRVSDSLEKYVMHKNSKPLFNDKQIKIMKENIVGNIGLFVQKEIENLPDAVIQQFEKQNGIKIQWMIDYNKECDYKILVILKEGSRNNPKNLVAFRVDIEKNKPPFVVFENLKPEKDKQKFFDINARQISYVDYRDDEVELTIIQPNDSPKKIIVSLSEWLANRNDLR